MIGIAFVIVLILNSIPAHAQCSKAAQCSMRGPCELIVQCEPCVRQLAGTTTACIESSDGRNQSCTCSGNAIECKCEVKPPVVVTVQPTPPLGPQSPIVGTRAPSTTTTAAAITTMGVVKTTGITTTATRDSATAASGDLLPGQNPSTLVGDSSSLSNTQLEITTVFNDVDGHRNPPSVAFPGWAIGVAVAGGGVLLLAIAVLLLVLALRARKRKLTPSSPASLHHDAAIPGMMSARDSTVSARDSNIYDAPPVEFLNYGSAPQRDSRYDAPAMALN